MFESYKELLETRIDQSIEDYSTALNTKEDIEEEINTISAYQKLKKSSMLEKTLGIVDVSAAIVMLPIAISTGGINFLYLLSGYFIVQSIRHGVDLKNVNKQLKNNRYNSKDFSTEEIENIKEEYNIKLKSTEKSLEKSKEEFRKANYNIECISELEKHIKDSTNSTYNEPKLYDEYLTDIIEYSSIYFDNSVSEPINYTEDSKKLFKKM